jgi:Domain of unknown function DUF11
MSGIKDQHELNEMRKRLYSRGFDTEEEEAPTLTDIKVDVARDWGTTPAFRAGQQSSTVPVTSEVSTTPESVPSKGHKYRKFVLVGSLGVFALVAIAAAAFSYLGTNKISGENINLNISGPSTIGGSETMSFQVGVTNQNAVAIDSAVLVMKYPKGARSVTEPVKNLYEERITIGTLNPAEAKNIPVQAAIYGKENEQQQIEATLEYRITGSDGTFYKVAEPLKFQITSSPLLLEVSSLRKVSAGQEVEITIIAKSNSPKILKDILVSASYPDSFTYKQSDPEPIYNQNTWMIKEIKPEGSAVIKLKGQINGLSDSSPVIQFSAGASETDNQFIVGSLLAETKTEFFIESPFLKVDIAIDGDSDRSVILERGKTSPVTLTVTNTLDESVYDMVVEVVPSGNALRSDSIETNRGYYDSNKGVIRWDGANNPDLAQVLPKESRTLQFSILADKINEAASFDLTVNVYARRVAEASAQEKLIGTVKATAKYGGSVDLKNQVNLMTGPIPPRVGQNTTYLIALVASAGSNKLTNTTVKTSLPSYVNWLNEYDGSGTVYFNPVTKQLEWTVGDIDANTSKELVFSVSILPSTSQVGTVPVLLNQQELRGVDRFTGSTVSAVEEQIDTSLPLEGGYQAENGVVTP